MDSAEVASFGYSKSFAYGQLILGPLIMVPFASLLAFSLYMLASGQGRDHVFELAGGAVACLWVLVIFAQWIRYRHALWESYTLDDHGVRIESESGVVRLAWSDFSSAEYLAIPGMLRLESHRLKKPVFLFMSRGWRIRQDQLRNNAGHNLVKRNMNDRYRTVWTL